jgi:bacterioferritin (cytochrome b1)
VLVESMLTDEEDHIDLLEEQLDQMDQMGYEFFLNQQV